MRDEVLYELPLPPFGDLALPLVRRDLAQIFDYRREALERELAAFKARAGAPAPQPAAS